MVAFLYEEDHRLADSVAKTDLVEDVRIGSSEDCDGKPGLLNLRPDVVRDLGRVREFIHAKASKSGVFLHNPFNLDIHWRQI